MRMTQEQYDEIQARRGCKPAFKLPTVKESLTVSKKPRRYRNEPVELDGETFDSKHELRCYLVLKALEAKGEITDLRRQVPFVLAPAVKLGGRTKPALRIVLDFTFNREGVLVAADAKSAITRKKDMYRAKAHLLKHVHGLDIEEI